MYGTVARVAASYPGQQWNPETGTPTAAQVTGWLELWSGAVNGRLAHLVQVPVSETASPILWALLVTIVELFARAEVYDHLNPPVETQASPTRLCEEWRQMAWKLLDGILLGDIADGVPSTLTPADAGGAPLGDEKRSPTFTLDQRF